MSRLVQYVDKGEQRRIAVASEDSSRLHPLSEVDRVYDLALEGIRRGRSLESLIQSQVRGDSIDYEPIIREQRLLPPLDHRDPARCLVSLTGLTHIGSAKSRDEMHGAAATIPATDSIRMFDIGVAGGKPVSGKIGAQPEWAYKGDGRCVVPPEQPLTQSAFAEDGGEEAEIAGLYVIDDNGTPWRVGYSIGNEFSDHLLERTNYLYLAHSKLRECSFGLELYVGELPDRVTGTGALCAGRRSFGVALSKVARRICVTR